MLLFSICNLYYFIAVLLFSICNLYYFIGVLLFSICNLYYFIAVLLFSICNLYYLILFRPTFHEFFFSIKHLLPLSYLSICFFY